MRLEGTNVELGKKIIGESGLNVIPADDLDDAAQKIVKAVEGGRVMSILIDNNTKVICQGFTGKNGTFHSEQAHRLRHQDGRRRLAGQGRLDPSRPAGVRHGCRGPRGHAAPTPP